MVVRERDRERGAWEREREGERSKDKRVSKLIGYSGKRFNIEIQISDEADYDKRALYYWAKLYTEQLEVAEDYSTLSKAIGIHILNFISIPEVDKYHNVFHITEKETGESYFKDLELHTIELKKFSKDSNEKLPDIVAKVKTSLDMWLAFLTRNDLLQPDDLPKSLENNDLKKALTVLDVMNFSSTERDAYEDHLKWLRIEVNTLKKAEVKGVEKGREEGREERNIEVAIKMLKQNLDDSLISSVTGLSNEQLLKLKNKM